MTGLVFIDRDNIKKMKIAKLLRKMSKFSLIGYVIFFLIRVAFFFDVRTQLNKLDKQRYEKGWGSFYAEYV